MILLTRSLCWVEKFAECSYWSAEVRFELLQNHRKKNDNQTIQLGKWCAQHLWPSHFFCVAINFPCFFVLWLLILWENICYSRAINARKSTTTISSIVGKIMSTNYFLSGHKTKHIQIYRQKDTNSTFECWV